MKLKLFPVKIPLVILDAISWLIALLVLILWGLVNVKSNLSIYVLEYIVLATTTILIGSLLGKYSSLRNTRFLYITLSTILTWIIVSGLIWVMHYYITMSLSLSVAYGGINIVILLNFIYLCGFYFWRYAQYMETDEHEESHTDREVRSSALEEPKERPLSEQTILEESIKEYTSEVVYEQIAEWVDLHSTNTRVVANTDAFSIKKIPNYRYDTIVNLKLLNKIRGVNMHFCMVNEKLPDNGEFVCCFRPQMVMKERILTKYPFLIRWIVYCMFFTIHRILPKLLTTSRIYFDLTKGSNRVFSKTEVLGRLYYCGFEVVEEIMIGHMVYVKARRLQNPQPQSRARRYGPLIKLLRVGKNGKKFNVYKMRTMHPYSEFLQKYIFEKNSLQEGGKIKDDIRVSTMGAFMRKYWLDELPMFINFFKGDMKFVGVRPLSSHYFSLYSKELQEKRTKFKPGLFPPFYADMPKTLDDIQASEMRYLEMCEKKGTFLTDIIYIWKIFVNIVFKKARSK